MSANSSTIFSCEQLSVTVPGRQLVDDLGLALSGGEFVAVLGQNGAGKSLTLHTLAGLRAPTAGCVRLAGEDLATLRRKDIARRLALLPQHSDDAFAATVFDTALAGRHPHVPPLQWESAADRDITLSCLKRVDLAALAGRDLLSLSGGERRRLAIAQILAQQPQVFLLDEPTNHLDPQHQLDVLKIFRAEANAGATVVASLHDVNLAARFATTCLLLMGDGTWQYGAVDKVLSAVALSALYATPMEAVDWRGRTLYFAGD